MVAEAAGWEAAATAEEAATEAEALQNSTRAAVSVSGVAASRCILLLP
jgi:hypothetical protein